MKFSTDSHPHLKIVQYSSFGHPVTVLQILMEKYSAIVLDKFLIAVHCSASTSSFDLGQSITSICSFMNVYVVFNQKHAKFSIVFYNYILYINKVYNYDTKNKCSYKY